jgi:mono/diheme cytochrome c family protein
MKLKTKLTTNLVLISAILFLGCTKQKTSAPLDPQQALIEKGRKSYFTYCISCHNSNPKLDGAIGPAIWGSSLELIEAKTQRGEYPAGYKPKRETKAMAVLPFVKDDLAAIHAFLQN